MFGSRQHAAAPRRRTARTGVSQHITRACRGRRGHSAGSPRRSGIILLVVLVLLALFTMMLITYVVATMNNRQSVVHSSRVEQTGDPPNAQLYDGVLQLLRGTKNGNSVIGPHSLLEDMYGHRGARGQIDAGSGSVSQMSSGGNPTPIIQFTSTFNVASNPFPPPSEITNPPFGYYNGLTITMIDGPAAGRSSRIVGYSFDPPAAYGGTGTNKSYFQVLNFAGLMPNPGDHFLVNGRPFSGTGFGFRPYSYLPTIFSGGSQHQNQSLMRLLDAGDPTLPGYNPGYDPTSMGDSTVRMFRNGTVLQYALLPNPRKGVFAAQGNSASPNPMTDYLDPAGPGGANEEYDAPDFQNMLLAMRVWSQSTGTLLTPLPSLHRPDLINYWNTRWTSQTGPGLSSNGTNNLLADADPTINPPNTFAQSVLRKIVFRPLRMDHPYFTGSNPNPSGNPFGIDLINGPWDVDNDGDGVPDSVWVDLGFPAQTSADGKRYKPLFAVLCVDMDGKLNLNAHTNWRHAPPPPPSTPPLPPAPPPVPSRFTQVYAPFMASPPPSAASILKIGSGYGPPEISLHPLFDPATAPAPTNELKNLLGGIPISVRNPPVEGRYGEVELTAALGVPPSAGITFLDDPLSYMRETNLPRISNWASSPPPNYPQHTFPYLPITVNSGPSYSPYNIAPFTINTSMWSTGTGRWVQGAGSAYGSPPDLDGDGMIAIDLRGQPLYIDYPATVSLNYAYDAGWGEPDESIDDPYELNLSLNAPNEGYTGTSAYTNFATNKLTGSSNVVSVDAPFTAAEFERVLRRHDIDAASLPDRLIQLAPKAFTSTDPLGTGSRSPHYPEIEQMPSLLTSHSYDLACPTFVTTSRDLTGLILGPGTGGSVGALSNSHISQLLASRIRSSLATQNASFPVDYTISQLLSPDLIAGEKMNINRPLGDGYDINNNGVVDEPGEMEFGWPAIYGPAPNVQTGGVELDLDNDGKRDGVPNGSQTGWTDANGDGVVNGFDAPGMQARQNLAKHLYVLMMLLADHTFVAQVDADGDGTVGGPNDTAYYFAQWAINVVDFCDADSIMTPFEFDIHPFTDEDSNYPGTVGGTTIYSTWDVDGVVIPKNVTGAYQGHNDDGSAYRGLVWGCERPELLITETLATHDRRTRDTTQGTGPNGDGGKLTTGAAGNQDDDFDQVRRPQGSLVIELFNPNPPLTVGNKIADQGPTELYAAASNDTATNAPQFGVNLSAAPSGSPVWRLVTLKLGTTAPTTRKPVLDPNLVDRVVYFTTTLPTTNEWQGLANPPTSFPAQSAFSNVVVPPNTYALVGPAALDPYDQNGATQQNLVLHLGQRYMGADEPPDDPTNQAVTKVYNTYPYRIRFATSGSNAPNVFVDGASNGSATYSTLPPKTSQLPYEYLTPYAATNYASTDMKATVGVPIATVQPTANTSTRMSISEPTLGYPNVGVSKIAATNPTAAGDTWNENLYYSQPNIPDTPYDLDSQYFTNDAARMAYLNQDGTFANASTVYLQRLANPLLPWDSAANPYIIVDQLPVDLTAFNSENDTASPVPEKKITKRPAPNNNLDSRRRGVGSPAGGLPPATNQYNVYSQASVDPTQFQPTIGTIQRPLPYASFGFLNQELVPPTQFDTTGATPTYKWWWTSGDAPVTFNPAPGTAGAAVPKAEYRGDPRSPFPWLTWNNRPFVSSKELMIVPLGSPSSLLSDMTAPPPLGVAAANGHGGGMWGPTLAPLAGDPYEFNTNPQPPAVMGEFGHLPNMFHSPQYNPVGGRTQSSPNFYRLLEYVHVPSRFVGTESWLPASKMQESLAASTIGLPNHQLHPPFNRVSQLRDPGRVNLNTIFDPFIWQGLFDDAQSALGKPASPKFPWVSLWNSFCQSRLGNASVAVIDSNMPNPNAYMVPLPNVASTNPQQSLPSIFGAPFRSHAGQTLVPLRSMQVANAHSVEREVEGTLLRSSPIASPLSYPLFEYPGWYPNSQPVWSDNIGVDDPYRNPYFAYKAFRRLDNLTTTRSNVYAIWLTVGYFEVTQAPSGDPQRNAKYPDGWVLGPEIGSDTGNIERHRAFYMYDRTIPVGFERGENHNVHRGILLERFIE